MISGEEIIKTLHLAYLSLADFFVTRSELELSKGYADIVMAPFFAK